MKATQGSQGESREQPVQWSTGCSLLSPWLPWLLPAFPLAPLSGFPVVILVGLLIGFLIGLLRGKPHRGGSLTEPTRPTPRVQNQFSEKLSNGTNKTNFPRVKEAAPPP